MDENRKPTFLMVPGMLLALAAGLSVPLFPNLLRASIQRHWLYSVDTAPLDPRWLLFTLAAVGPCAIAIWASIRPWPRPISRKTFFIAAGLILFFLLPLKNGSFSHALFYAWSGLASVWIWKATPGWQEGSAKLLSRCGRWVMEVPRRRWRAGLFGAGLIFNLASVIFIFDLVPHGMDEIDYLFQAKIFARGHCWAPLPVVPDFFHHGHLIFSGDRWFSQYPPGWPALLSLGVRLGAPWLVNPLLGALGLVLIFELGRELFNERIARIAGLLALVSPYYIIMNSSMMSHPACGVFALAYWLWFERGLSRRSPSRLFLAGLFLGAAASIRPYTAFLIALPGAGSMLLELVRRPRPTFKLALAALLGPAIPLALLFAYNHHTTGSALVFGYQLLYGQTIALGFGDRQFQYPHTLLEGLRICHSRLLTLSHNLVPSAVPALAIAGLGLTPGKLDGKTIRLMLGFLSLPVGYVFYFFQDFYYEPRFYFESSGLLIVLVALGLSTAAQRFGDSSSFRHYLVVLIALGLLIFIPLQLSGYRRAGDLGPELKQLVREQKLSGALVLMDPLLYPMGMMLQSPFLDGDNIYVRHLPGREAEIFSAYPARPAYRFHYDLGTGRFELAPFNPG